MLAIKNWIGNVWAVHRVTKAPLLRNAPSAFVFERFFFKFPNHLKLCPYYNQYVREYLKYLPLSGEIKIPSCDLVRSDGLAIWKKYMFTPRII